MQGLPTQLLSKSAKAQSLVDKSVKADGVAVESNKNSDKDFASMFEGLKSADNTPEAKDSKVVVPSKEAIISLLGADQNAEAEMGEEEILSMELNPKQAEALLLTLMANKDVAQNGKSAVAVDSEAAPLEQKIAKTTSNLDQLLNSLKGTQDSEEEVLEESDSLQNIRPKNSVRPQGVMKAENPLEFLMNGGKSKDVSATTPSEESTPSDIESLLGQKKIMTGEDFLQNMESADKAGAKKLVLMNGLELPKNANPNMKAYGQGLALLSDPLIKNTKDLAFKDKSIGKASADELKSPDMKVSAELSAIKQDVIPMMQNKENQGQSTESKTEANQKVLDLGKLNTANTTEIIKRISDYVEQNQVANKSSLDLTVKHDSLGEFKIQVSRMPTQAGTQAQSMIDMQITTSSKEGHDFFMKNEIGLMKNLNNAGINLSDLRIVSSMGESSTAGQADGRQSGSNQNSDAKQFMNGNSSFAGEFSNGKERRKELWEEYQQRYGA